MSATAQRFVLNRLQDDSGIPGSRAWGLVAWGVRFPDGVCAIHWATEPTSTTVFGSIHDVHAIHGHQGHTRIDWIDES